MDQKWIQILGILLFCQTARGVILKEGSEHKLTCEPEMGTIIMWFKVLDRSGAEFIASFSKTGMIKAYGKDFYKKFKVTSAGLHLRSFSRLNDSGIYCCASLVDGNKLNFGEVNRLSGEEPTTPAPPMLTITQTSTATKSCACKEMNKADSSMFCSPFILSALAGSCGLLLLFLIVVTVYCNHMRTRRCPHHNKRKLRVEALQKQMTNRHI